MGRGFVMCDNDIKYLAGRLGQEDAKILECLISQPLDQQSVRRQSGLTMAVTQRELLRLEGAGFISATAEKRRTIYTLTASGVRLFQLYEIERGEADLK